MKALDAIFDYTLFTLKITGTNNFAGLIFSCVINSAIRASVVYLTIRLVITAISHGSF